LRALLKAASGRHVKIMFPMISTVDEFHRARDIFEREMAYLTRHGYEHPAETQLGVMVEVPSLLFEIEEMARCADFLSVGSNDLMQFLFAADRENPAMAHRCAWLSRAVDVACFDWPGESCHSGSSNCALARHDRCGARR
jgi:phosphotransferase system enzyme I (PtsP)